MIGNILLYLTIVLTIASIISISKRYLSKPLIIGQSIISVFMMGYMIWALVSDNFQIRYVFHHSEKALPWIYKISALWAGDSGSLILWSAIISIVLLFLVLKKKTDSKTMITVLIFQLFVLSSIVFTNPFAMSSKSFIDGQGLNLLLKNFWMLSHPPITFIAYSLMIVPFGLTLNFALSKNQSADSWRDQIKPWILATWLFLGVGIVFGAIWSYEVIGWGGYWGWDPVENATLIPWLFLSAALHSLPGNKNTRQNLRSTVGFTLASFVSIVLAVFITRSGILSDVSVHSFSGQPLSIILTILLILSVLASIFVCLKLKDKAEKTEEPPLLSKSFLIGAGNLVVLIFSAVVLVATFWPVITKLIGSNQVISTSFYSVILAPVGILLSAGIAFTPIFKWGKTEKDSLPKKLISPMLVGIIGIWLLYELGVFIPVVIILVFLSAFTLVSNVMQMKALGWKKWGSNIAHIGLSILIVGIVVSSNFQFIKQDILRINQKSEVIADRTLVLNSFSLVNDNGDYEASVSITDVNNNVTEAKLTGIMDKTGSWVVEPFIKRGIVSDVILAPGKPELGILMAPSLGESVDGNGYSLFLTSIDDKSVEVSLADEHDAWVLIFDRNNDDTTELLEPTENLVIYLEEVGKDYVRARITDMRPDVGNTVMLPITFSVKYLISFVWIGMILILIGILWALIMRNRKKETIELERIDA